MRIGKISVLFCMVAPVAGLTASRLAPAGEADFYGVGTACLGLGIFAGLTLIGGLVGVAAHLKGSKAGLWTIGWSVLALAALGVWVFFLPGGLL